MQLVEIKKNFRALYVYVVNDVFSGVCLKHTELIDCTLDNFRVLYIYVYVVNDVFSGICLKETDLIDCTLDNIQKIVIQIVHLI